MCTTRKNPVGSSLIQLPYGNAPPLGLPVVIASCRRTPRPYVAAFGRSRVMSCLRRGMYGRIPRRRRNEEDRGARGHCPRGGGARGGEGEGDRRAEGVRRLGVRDRAG